MWNLHYAMSGNTECATSGNMLFLISVDGSYREKPNGLSTSESIYFAMEIKGSFSPEV